MLLERLYRSELAISSPKKESAVGTAVAEEMPATKMGEFVRGKLTGQRSNPLTGPATNEKSALGSRNIRETAGKKREPQEGIALHKKYAQAQKCRRRRIVKPTGKAQIKEIIGLGQVTRREPTIGEEKKITHKKRRVKKVKVRILVITQPRIRGNGKGKSTRRKSMEERQSIFLGGCNATCTGTMCCASGGRKNR